MEGPPNRSHGQGAGPPQGAEPQQTGPPQGAEPRPAFAPEEQESFQPTPGPRSGRQGWWQGAVVQVQGLRAKVRVRARVAAGRPQWRWPGRPRRPQLLRPWRRCAARESRERSCLSSASFFDTPRPLMTEAAAPNAKARPRSSIAARCGQKKCGCDLGAGMGGAGGGARGEAHDEAHGRRERTPTRRVQRDAPGRRW